MATPVSPPPIDVAAIFQRVLDEYRDPRGLLPLKLARTSSGTLDAAVRQDMLDRGVDRFTADEYETTLRSEIEELLTTEPVAAVAVGQEIADMAHVLAGEDASYAVYAEKLGDARDWLRARARRDVLQAFRAKTRREAFDDLAELQEMVKSRRGHRADGVVHR